MSFENHEANGYIHNLNCESSHPNCVFDKAKNLHLWHVYLTPPHLSITDPSTLAGICLLGEKVGWKYCYFETPLLSYLALKWCSK